MSEIVASRQIAATGTPDNTKFLRGDDVWAVPTGGGGGGWTQVVAEDGSSFADFTAASGTWASDGTVITQTDTGDDRRARFNTKFPWAICIVEAEILIVSGSGTDQRAGILVGFDGTDGGGLFARLHINGSTPDGIQMEPDATAPLWTKAMDWGDYNEWHKIRVLLSGGMASMWLDEVFQGTAGNNANREPQADYIGLCTGDVSAKFRNLNAWTLDLP